MAKVESRVLRARISQRAQQPDAAVSEVNGRKMVAGTVVVDRRIWLPELTFLVSKTDQPGIGID
jgi:hypothetical protein